MAQIIAPCVDAVKESGLVESTEDLQSCLERFNSLPDEERQDVVALSMDATALYPSITVERSSEVVYELLIESNLVYENIMWWSLLDIWQQQLMNL